jgi:tetratricopeptide (TPR) repeat protein
MARQAAELAEFEQSREAVGYARQLFKRHAKAAESSNGLAQCEYLDGYLLWRFGDLLSSADTLKRALNKFRKLGDEVNEAVCEYQLGVTLATNLQVDDAWEHVDAARQKFERLNLGIEVARADVSLAKMARHEGRSTDAENRLIGSLAIFEKAGLAMEAADAIQALADIYIADHRPVEAEPLLREGLRRYQRLRRETGAAFCETGLAKVLRDLAQPGEALALALSAIRRFDAIRYKLPNPRSRESWALSQHDAQTVALEIAAESRDARLTAELIETARSQGFPVGSQDLSNPKPDRMGEAPAPGLSVVNSLPLATVRPIMVEGVTKIGRTRDALELTSVAADIGGDRSWWWGTWQVGERLWWSLLRPGKIVEAGSISVAEDSAAWQAIDDWHGALPLDESAGARTRRVRGGPLFDRVAEERLADRLGQALLPPSLREALSSRSAADKPIPLMVASCGLLGRIPVAALGIGNNRRVMEAAIIRMAPAAGLIAALSQEIRAGRRGTGGPGSLHVGVFDPAAGQELPYAAQLQASAGALISLQAKTATRKGLADALRSVIVQPGQPGLFVYAGHARMPTLGISLLCLHRPSREVSNCPIGNCCGGDPLSVEDLLSARPEAGDYAYPMPGRVLLSGCDTAGLWASGAGGEWMGLAPAFLWAGARIVLATLWPTLDHPNSLNFETALIRALKHDADPATSLRALQLEELDCWRQQTSMATADEVPAASPLLWAAYVAVGFASA